MLLSSFNFNRLSNYHSLDTAFLPHTFESWFYGCLVYQLLFVSVTFFVSSFLQLYHAVGRDRKPLRKKYLEAIVPPFVAVLRRWRPLLAGIHELATADGFNPLTVEDRALAADALPIEVCLFNINLCSL